MDMEQRERIYSNRQLVQLIWPLLVEQLLNVLVGMIDVLMVAVLGEATVSGVSLVDSINMLIINILSALTAGGTVVCSQYVGSRQIQKSGRAAGQMILLTVSFTAAVSIGLLVGGRSLLGLIFGQVDADVMANAAAYCAVTACSFPFLALYNSSASAFRAIGNSKLPMEISLLMNGLNIVGNALLIFGFGMGVTGVALATLLARAAAAMILFRCLQQPGNEIRLSGIADLKPDGREMRRILAIGIPSGLEGGTFQLGKLMLQSLVATLGTASIAGFAVACNLVTFLYLPGNALGLGLTTVAGQCFGACELKQAKHYSAIFQRINYAILAIIGAVMLLGLRHWVGFYNLTPEAAAIAATMVRDHTIAMVIWPPAFLRSYFFRACNRAKFTMKVSIFVMWVFRVGCAWLFVKVLHGTVITVWYAMFIDWVVRTAIYEYNFRKFPVE